MKKTTISRVLAVSAAFLIFMSSGTLGAQALPASETLESCMPSQVDKGECITAVISPGQDPVVNGVKQQLQMGVAPEAVTQFVERRGRVVDDASQDKIEEIVRNHEPSGSKKEAQSSTLTEEPVRMMNAGGVGTVVNNTLDVTDTVTYMYCSSSTGICSKGGSVQVEFRMAIEGNMSFALSGDLNVTSGSPVLIEQVKCETYHDGLFNIDTVVHTWNNCTNAKTFNEVMYRQIFIENWSGGSLNEVYHPTYTVQFFNYAGGRFSMAWDGKEYKVASDGRTTWQ